MTLPGLSAGYISGRLDSCTALMFAFMAFALAGVYHSLTCPMDGSCHRDGSINSTAQDGLVVQQLMHTVLLTLKWLDWMYDHHH